MENKTVAVKLWISKSLESRIKKIGEGLGLGVSPTIRMLILQGLKKYTGRKK